MEMSIELAGQANLANKRIGGFGVLVLVVQTLYGAWFVVHGLNFFVEFFKQPPGASVLSHELISALIHSGLFAWIKVIEVVVGILLLAHLFVPLAIVLAAPITVVIAYLNLALNKDAFGLVVGPTILAANLVMALGYWDRYRPMLVMTAGRPRLHRLF